MALAKSQARRSARQLVIAAVGLVFALLAVTVFNFAAYMSLDLALGPIKAGLIVGAADLLLAALFFRTAFNETSDSDEEKLAREISEMSLSSLGEDMDEIRQEMSRFTADVRRIRSTIHSVTTPIQGMLRLFMHLQNWGDKVSAAAEPERESEVEAPKES